MKDEKDRIIEEQRQRIAELERLLKAALERIAVLERQLKLNSENSGKPPSSDGLQKKIRVTSSREKTGKNTGGQEGHVGHTLRQTQTPDHVVTHGVIMCEVCNTNLENTPMKHVIKRQVIDIPPPKIEVTEHQAEVKICTCGHATIGKFPNNVRAPVQYGERLQGLAVYLSTQQLIPEDRLQQTLADIFNCDISTATLANINTQCAKKMKPEADAILAALKAADVKGLDETGFRIGGRTNWLHTICNELYTHYRHSHRRGDLLEGVSGVVVHDHWKRYFKMTGAIHALCNAHHLRELKALEEIEKEPWAFKMRRLLQLICRMCRLNDPPLQRIFNLYDQIVEEGLRFHTAQTPLSNRPNKRRTGHNLLLRLRDYKDAVLRCLTIPGIPFTNNMSEQALRMMKVKQKISGGFRTTEGAHTFCTIRTIIDTARKQNKNILQTLCAFIAA